MPLLLLGPPDGGGQQADAAAAAWPQIMHGTGERLGDGQEKDVLELGDCVLVHSLQVCAFACACVCVCGVCVSV